MVLCGVCNRKVNRGEDLLTCSTNCGSCYHIACIDVSEEKFAELKLTGQINKWLCKNCNEGITSKMQEEKSKQEYQPSSEKIDIDQLITTKVKQAIGMITEEVINVLRKEIWELRAENCNLKKEVDNPKNYTAKLVCENISYPSTAGVRSSVSNKDKFDSLTKVKSNTNNVISDASQNVQIASNLQNVL